MNAIVVREQEQGMGAPRRDPYMMEVDKRRNCYTCGGFGHMCYDSMLKVLSKELTLVLSDTRELDRVPSTELSTLYTSTHGPC